MSDEPLYCTQCGAADWNCEHWPRAHGAVQDGMIPEDKIDDLGGPYCHFFGDKHEDIVGVVMPDGAVRCQACGFVLVKPGQLAEEPPEEAPHDVH